MEDGDGDCVARGRHDNATCDADAHGAVYDDGVAMLLDDADGDDDLLGDDLAQIVCFFVI